MPLKSKANRIRLRNTENNEHIADSICTTQDTASAKGECDKKGM